MRRILLGVCLLLASLSTVAQTLSVTQAGSGNTATIAVTSSGQLKLVWDAADNWGLDGWYDLVNDPTATTNLASPVYSVNGSSVPCAEESGLSQYVFYSEGDEKIAMKWVSNGCTYSSTSRSMEIITNTSSLVVLQTTALPIVTSGPSSDLVTRMTYFIFPDGKVYVHLTINALGSITLGTGAWGSDFAMMMGLPNSLQTGTAPPDSQSIGWVRASATQNPYNFNNSNETYLYAYWGSSSGAFGYGSSMTPKASIMIVPSPNNTYNTALRQGIHSWACGTGCGVTRWGYSTTTAQSLVAGQTISYDWLLQFGTVGSGALPNMTVAPPTNCTVCDTIANAYIASPYPNAGLLTGKTPSTYSVPSGWTATTTETFDASSCPGAWYCTGDYTGTQAHSGAKALHAVYNPGPVNWNYRLPVGTRQVYVSWYEYLTSAFRMNDEMFLARFHWDTGNGQPDTREAILDYFMNSSLAYNSTDATMLWNIQGAPYYQNRLPTNERAGKTNFPILTNQWVQWELYMQFSTVSGTFSPGSVTFNATSHTYTRTTGSWIADGVTLGSSPHFSGFVNVWNNGPGLQGGGGDSYFVTALTDTVMTVTPDCCNTTTTETATVTYNFDKADGSYQLYQNGLLVAFQDAMVSPGKVDFSTSNTTLSLGESYTKNIWHGQVAGVCESHPPFTGTCSSTMTGCDYDNLENANSVNVLGWNGAGLTKSGPTFATFDTHIDCDATWGGPMPTPPVFDRYLDDIIVLTKSATTPSSAAGGMFGNAAASGGIVIQP